MIPKINVEISGSSRLALLMKQCFGNQITEQINELNRIVGGNRISNAAVDIEGHGGVDQCNNGNLKLESLVDDGRLAVGVDNDDAIGGLGGAEDEFLVAGAELLGAVTVGEEAAGAPEGAGGDGVGANLLGHEVEDVVEERVGVDEHEAGVVAGEGGDEIECAAHANEGFVGVDDGHLVAEAIGVALEMVSSNSSTHLRIRAQQLLYHYRMNRHDLPPSILSLTPLGFFDFSFLSYYYKTILFLNLVFQYLKFGHSTHRFIISSYSY